MTLKKVRGKTKHGWRDWKDYILITTLVFMILSFFIYVIIKIDDALIDDALIEKILEEDLNPIESFCASKGFENAQLYQSPGTLELYCTNDNGEWELYPIGAVE